MSGDGTDALEQALALRLVPARLPALRSRPLPENVLVLLELAAGRREAIDQCAGRTAESPRTLVEAATLFIQQVLFEETSDHYRLLGAQPGDPVDTIHEHHRWLMRWLHPDRDATRWETAFSERVNVAWHILRSPERRQQYDRWLESTLNPRRPRVVGSLAARRPVEAEDKSLRLSPRVIRQLPFYAIALLAIVCGALVAREYQTQSQVDLPIVNGVASPRDVEAEAARKALAEDRDQEDFGALGATAPAAAAPDSVRPTPSTEEEPGITGGDSAASSSVIPLTSRNAETAMSSLSEVNNDLQPPASPPVSSDRDTTAIESAVARMAPSNSADLKVSTVGPTAVDGPDRASRATAESASRLPVMGRVSALSQSADLGTVPDEDRHLAVGRRGETRATNLPAAPRLASSARARGNRSANDSSPTPPAEAAVSLREASRSEVDSRRPDISSTPRSAPAATSIQTPSELLAVTSTSARPLSPAEAVRSLSRALPEAYARGNIEHMMRLFAPDAVENRGGVDAIEADYRTLFNQTSSRELDLAGLTWVLRSDRIIGDGAFVAIVRASGRSSARRVKGWLHIEAVPMDGEWKIHSLLHRDDR